MPALIDSPQANVPDYLPVWPVSLDGTTIRNQLVPQPPNVITNTVGPADAYNVITVPSNLRANVIFVQNNSVQPVYYAYNTAATATVYHGIIPGAGVASNGTGGKAEFDVEKYGISRISLLSASGNLNVSIETFSKLAV